MTDTEDDGASGVIHDLSEKKEIFEREAGGLMRVRIFRPQDAVELFVPALSGDREAIRMLKTLASTIKAIEESPPTRRRVCGSCNDEVFGSNYSLVVGDPATDDPAMCICIAICFSCGTDVTTIKRRSMEAFSLYWDVREVNRAHIVPGGRA